MGLFSSKKKVTVNTTVMRVIEDKLLPYTHKSSLIESIVNQTELTEGLIEGLKNSVAVKADNMFAYAKEQYYYGLPNHNFMEKDSGQAIIKRAIETELGIPVRMLYYKFAPINSVHLGWKELLEKYNYNHKTNEIVSLSVIKGHKVYLDDIKAIYTKETLENADPEVFEQWGSSALTGFANHRRGQGLFHLTGYIQHSPWSVDESLTEDVVELHYSWSAWEKKMVGPYETVEEIFYKEKIVVPITEFPDDQEYFQAMYEYTRGGVTKLGCWVYRDDSGVHPEVDAIYSFSENELGSYFPFTFFRIDGKNQAGADFEYKAPYETSQKMLNYLGLSFKDLANDIDSNPGIEDVIQAMMIMAVPASGKSEVECRYLYEYFNRMFEAGEPDTAWPVPPKDNSDGIYRKKGVAIAIKDADFQITLRYSGIGKRKVAGSIGKVGTFARTSGTETSYKKYSSANSGAVNSYAEKQEYIGYQKQTSDTFYEEVRVYNLNMLFPIKGKYSTSASGLSDKMLIPLDKSITDLMPATQKEELYCRSLHFVFNTYVETETKWYQQSWFKWVLITVAIVITIFTWGSASPGVWATITAMNAATVALVWGFIKSLVISLAMKYGLAEVAKMLGPEWAIVVAVIGMAVGVYGMAGDATWATNLLEMSSGLVDGASKMIQAGMEEIRDAFGELQLLMDSNAEALREAEKLLGMQDLLNPFAFIGKVPELRIGETPDNFFTRTIHAGNIAVASLEMPGVYVDMALRLPKVEDTLGEFGGEMA